MPRELDMAREMGEQSADITTLKSEVAFLRKDVSEIKEMLATNRGGVRMLLAVGGVAATIGASIAGGIAETIHWLHK